MSEAYTDHRADLEYNGPKVKSYRPPPRGDVPYKSWKDEARCVNIDPQLFELQDPDDISEDDQHELIAWGLQICASCPVRQDCLSDSSELDRYWSTRGGQPPEGLFPDSKLPRYLFPQARKQGYKPGSGPAREPAKKCRRGHEEWAFRKDGKRYCAACKRQNWIDYEARRKPKK